MQINRQAISGKMPCETAAPYRSPAGDAQRIAEDDDACQEPD